MRKQFTYIILVHGYTYQDQVYIHTMLSHFTKVHDRDRKGRGFATTYYREIEILEKFSYSSWLPDPLA